MKKSTKSRSQTYQQTEEQPERTAPKYADSGGRNPKERIARARRDQGVDVRKVFSNLV